MENSTPQGNNYLWTVCINEFCVEISFYLLAKISYHLCADILEWRKLQYVWSGAFGPVFRQEQCHAVFSVWQ